jgi:hypothetical protein
MTTTSDPLDVTTAWQEVASGSASVSVQSRSTGMVYVAAQAAIPAVGSKKGVILDGDDDVASFSGLAGTDKVFVRAETTAVVVVVKS